MPSNSFVYFVSIRSAMPSNSFFCFVTIRSAMRSNSFFYFVSLRSAMRSNSFFCFVVVFMETWSFPTNPKSSVHPSTASVHPSTVQCTPIHSQCTPIHSQSTPIHSRERFYPHSSCHNRSVRLVYSTLPPTLRVCFCTLPHCTLSCHVVGQLLHCCRPPR